MVSAPILGSGIPGRPVSRCGRWWRLPAEQHAPEADDGPPDQDIRHDGASHRHDQQLNGVDPAEHEQLVRSVEHNRDDEDPADVLQRNAEEPPALAVSG